MATVTKKTAVKNPPAAAKKAAPAKVTPIKKAAAPAKPAVRKAAPAKPAPVKPAAKKAPAPAKPAARKAASKPATTAKPVAKKAAAKPAAKKAPALAIDDEVLVEVIETEDGLVAIDVEDVDPAALVAGGEALRREAAYVLDAARGRPHIFNLGHGIVPQTSPEHVAALVRFVRAG